MEQNTLFTAQRTDLSDRLNRTDLVIGIHHRYTDRILTDRILEILKAYDTILMYRK